MNVKRLLLLSVLLFLTSRMALAEEQVAPPPNPTDIGPSLEVTMKFIQDKLNNQGAVNFVRLYHRSTDNADWTDKYSFSWGNVVANPTDCTITASGHFLLRLRYVEKIFVDTLANIESQDEAQGGHPEITIPQTNPNVFVVRGMHKEFSVFTSLFYDEDLANRVARALVHAAELCGGGNKEPF